MTKNTKSPETVWLNPYKRGNYQFFREWATAAWKRAGGTVLQDWNLPLKLKMAIGKIGLVFAFPMRHRRRLIVCTGGRPDYMSWPWCYFFEIVPIVWDCWPKYRPAMVRFIKKNNVHLVFCTASQTADFLNRTFAAPDTRKPFPFRAVWLPEGIDIASYPMGPRLADRTCDIMRFGRDAGGKLIYPTFEALTAAMRNSKIIICRPRCDTNPEEAGDIETLTQRYWEAMLSGAVISGRAPRELTDFCGYNPVIENEGPEMILSHIEDFQELVDKNRAFAEQNAAWDLRIKAIKAELGEPNT